MAEGEAIVGKCTEDNGWVDDILLKSQQPHIETLKPHQVSILWKHSILKSIHINNTMYYSTHITEVQGTDLWVQTVSTPYSSAQDERSTARDGVSVTEGWDSGWRSPPCLLMRTALWTQMATCDEKKVSWYVYCMLYWICSHCLIMYRTFKRKRNLPVKKGKPCWLLLQRSKWRREYRQPGLTVKSLSAT